jgi:YcaO-like protein with predicted kinase domain
MVDVESAATVDTAGRKTYFAGTHRVRNPARTWEWVEPLLPVVGVTRVADVTWLDDIGIPVYQAVRPNARTLSVSQGKGLDRSAAKVSAAMEAIELWHAERLETSVARVATVDTVLDDLGYDPGELVTQPRHCLNRSSRLRWWPARRLTDGAASLVPLDCVNLDARVARRWQPPVFVSSSNGLASGNTRDEATLHALYEVIERDAIDRAQRGQPRQRIDTDSVHGHGADLLRRFRAAGVEVRLEVLPSPFGAPCFGAVIWSDSFPAPIPGHGCHSDRDVAVCRALTEAAQARVTVIAGARDDVSTTVYRRARNVRVGAARPAAVPDAEDLPIVDLDSVGSTRFTDLATELEETVRSVVAVTGRSPLLVDHTRADLGVPVVRVVCPRLGFPRHR